MAPVTAVQSPEERTLLGNLAIRQPCGLFGGSLAGPRRVAVGAVCLAAVMAVGLISVSPHMGGHPRLRTAGGRLALVGLGAVANPLGLGDLKDVLQDLMPAYSDGKKLGKLASKVSEALKAAEEASEGMGAEAKLAADAEQLLDDFAKFASGMKGADTSGESLDEVQADAGKLLSDFSSALAGGRLDTLIGRLLALHGTPDGVVIFSAINETFNDLLAGNQEAAQDREAEVAQKAMKTFQAMLPLQVLNVVEASASELARSLDKTQRAKLVAAARAMMQTLAFHRSQLTGLAAELGKQNGTVTHKTSKLFADMGEDLTALSKHDKAGASSAEAKIEDDLAQFQGMLPLALRTEVQSAVAANRDAVSILTATLAGKRPVTSFF